MLPDHLSLTPSQAFAHTVKRGHRAGTKTVVVYLIKHTINEGLVRQGGPRFGFIVSKAVGNAVTRHRVTRRLRHICQQLAQETREVPGITDCDIVVRALPRSAQASSEQLSADVARGVDKLVAQLQHQETGACHG